ncbi:MAG: hypothetical protein AAGG51_09615 [Cyanobacteria bacterium P01_G01_bin.54]
MNVKRSLLFPVFIITLVLGVSKRAVSSPLPSKPLIFAQRDVSGECRQTNKAAFVYANRSTDSETLLELQQYEQVFLYDRAPITGWISINWPVEGFVWAADLTRCDGTFEPSYSKFCLHERFEDSSFPIRKDRSSSSDVEELVYHGDEVWTLGLPQFEEQSNTQWLQAFHPAQGWIEYGLPGENTLNFVPCNVPD